MRFLVSTDGSERSLDILPHAGRLARVVGAEIVFARVMDPHNDATHVVAPTRSEAVAQVTAEWLEAMSTALAAAGVEGEARVFERGRGEDIHDSLLRFGNEHEADLYGLDSHGYGALRQAILGSVTMGLLGKTALPVLTTGPVIAPPSRPAAEDYHIILTVDGSPASFAAVRAIFPLVEAGPVRVTLVRIYQPAPKDRGRAEELVDAERNLGDVADFLPGPQERVLREIEAGATIDATIVAIAAELEADAIAIATQGHSALRSVIMGSVANGVLKTSPLPLILARN